MAVRRSTLDEIAEVIHENHVDRLDPPFIDELVPRKNRRPTPKTAILSEIIKRNSEIET